MFMMGVKIKVRAGLSEKRSGERELQPLPEKKGVGGDMGQRGIGSRVSF